MQELHKGYPFKINWTSSEPSDPTNEAVDVRLTAPDGEEYSANVTTRGFLDYMFEKNRRTGECAGGAYFCMPGMIIVREITEGTVRATIDDLIVNHEMDKYFRKIH